MQQFVLIAVAHFLALLSPGPDFFLVLRTAAASGWRVAAGACLGIAAGNAVFVVAALGGVSLLDADGLAFVVIQLVGAGYLIWLAVGFLRGSGSLPAAETPAGPQGWSGAFLAGILSALLNPKNALFYASLATMVNGSLDSWVGRVALGTWLVLVVLGWDLLVAGALGRARVRARFATALPWVERACAVVMVVLAGGILISVLGRQR